MGRGGIFSYGNPEYDIKREPEQTLPMTSVEFNTFTTQLKKIDDVLAKHITSPAVPYVYGGIARLRWDGMLRQKWNHGDIDVAVTSPMSITSEKAKETLFFDHTESACSALSGNLERFRHLPTHDTDVMRMSAKCTLPSDFPIRTINFRHIHNGLNSSLFLPPAVVAYQPQALEEAKTCNEPIYTVLEGWNNHRGCRDMPFPIAPNRGGGDEDNLATAAVMAAHRLKYESRGFRYPPRSFLDKWIKKFSS